jgi:HPt (histidine-containing phosphotransfer) domain-containing protein
VTIVAIASEEPALSTWDDSSDSVFHRPGASWSQFDLGSDFDVSTLSVVAALDPSGANGVVADVLRMFGESLEPVLQRLERHRARADLAGIRFEAHKLYSAAGQLGALRLARSCSEVMRYFHEDDDATGQETSAELDARLLDLIGEIVRVQRKLAQLLNGEGA